MSTRIVTLFGEEIVPEPQKPAGKGRGKKSDKNAATDEPADETQEPQPIAETPVQATASQEQMPAPATEETSLPEETAIPIQQETVPEIVVEEVEAEAETKTEAMPGVVAEATPEAKPDIAKKSRKRKDEDGMVAKPDADIIPEDWSGEKKYYTIGEVAGFFKVATSHIRFWTNEFKLKVRTTRKGDRLYTPDQVKELRAIYHLVKERGFTLSGARTKLKEQNKRDVKTVDLKTSLQDLRSRLVKLRDQLI